MNCVVEVVVSSLVIVNHYAYTEKTAVCERRRRSSSTVQHGSGLAQAGNRLIPSHGVEHNMQVYAGVCMKGH
jgi:hypothetical protein